MSDAQAENAPAGARDDAAVRVAGGPARRAEHEMATDRIEQKCVAGQAPPDEPLLGNADIQSLTDLGNIWGDQGDEDFPLHQPVDPPDRGDRVPFRPAPDFPGDAREEDTRAARRGAALNAVFPRLSLEFI